MYDACFLLILICAKVTSSMVVSPNTDKVCFGNDKLCPFDSPISTPLSHPKHSGYYSNQATDKRLVQNGSANNSLNLGELSKFVLIIPIVSNSEQFLL